MVALDTRLPLALDNVRIDLAKPLADAANIEGKRLANAGQVLSNAGAGMRNELAGLSLAETKAKTAALGGYREAAAAGDPAAMDKLKGYPELQLQIRSALEGLEDVELADAEEQLDAVARSAEVVLAAPPEARPEIWNEQVDSLFANGHISEEQRDEYFDNYSEIVLDQSIVAAQTAEELRATREAKKKAAIDTAREYPAKESELSLKQKFEIEKAIADRIAAGAPDIGYASPKDERRAAKKAREEVLRSLGIEPDLSAGPTPDKKGAAGAAGVAPAPDAVAVAVAVADADADADASREGPPACALATASKPARASACAGAVDGQPQPRCRKARCLIVARS